MRDYSNTVIIAFHARDGRLGILKFEAKHLLFVLLSFQMKKDLDAFDPNFFEELEDLKYNYQEAVKRNVQYEEQLNSLAKQYGFPLDT